MPDDGPDYLAAWTGAMDAATERLIFQQFNLTHPQLIAALKRAFDRYKAGTLKSLLVILDKTEAATPVEDKVIKGLIAYGFTSDLLVVTASPDKRQFDHDKVTICDNTVFDGSTNGTPTAFEQENTGIVTVSQGRADWIAGKLTSLVQFARANEQTYESVFFPALKTAA
jgi:phosphatidylserine/phosphatidylglycerophosphate/cardiolipin synthase-like enzyme